MHTKCLYTNSAYRLSLVGGLIALSIHVLVGSGKPLSIAQVLALGVTFVAIGASDVWDKGELHHS
jgi:hypothetical protein